MDKKKYILVTLSIILGAFLIWQFVFAKSKTIPATKANTVVQKQHLKILYPGRQFFFINFGDQFLKAYPNIEIEVLESPLSGSYEEKLQATLKIIKENKPDIIFSQFFYDDYIKQGILYDISRKFSTLDSSAIDQEFIKSLKRDGKLYGLTPTFHTKAIFYNKNIFNQLHVTYPKDHMTWGELLSLASKLHNERVSGLYVPSATPFWLISNMTTTSSLNMIESNNRSLTHNKEFGEIFKTAIQSYRDKSVFLSPDYPLPPKSLEEDSKRNKFYSGEAAMYLGDLVTIQRLTQIFDEHLQNKFEWDMVTEPVDHSTPDESTSIELNGLFSINSNSKNVELSWEFLNYLNGKQFADNYYKDQQYDFLTRRNVLYELDGHNLSAFYKLLPGKNAFSIPNRDLKPEYISQVNEIIANETKNNIFTTISSEELLIAIERKISDMR